MRAIPLMSVFGVALALAPAASAIVIDGGDGSQNLSVPTDNPGWENVGQINGASGVYLGVYGGSPWVLTAAHVGVGSFLLDGTTYSALAGSGVQVTNADHSPADLELFRLTTAPVAPTLTLATTAPDLNQNAAALLVGFGLREMGSTLYWNVTGTGAATNWSALGGAAGSNTSGYAVGDAGQERWGAATLVAPASLGLDASFNIGTGLTQALLTEFNDTPGSAQAAGGDSGGALFYQTAGGWELGGIINAVGFFDNQPGGTAVIGQVTYAADLSQYSATILADVGAVPEPGTTGLLLGAAAALVASGWRRFGRGGSGRPAG